MAVKIRRTYKGAASAASLDSAGVASTTQTGIGLTTSPSNWPTGKFFVVVAPGTAQEEKMCVTLSGSTLTVVDPTNDSLSSSDEGRGVDDTPARSTIAAGSAVYPVFTAIDANEANELTSAYTAQGGMVYQGLSTFSQLAIGTAGHVLKVNSVATAPEWGQVTSSGIADNAVDTSEINNGAVTLAKLASAVANALVPVGTITAYGGATAPTGWLLCDGTSTSGYTSLAALVGATTPDLRGKFPIGKTASGTASTLLGTGGSTTIAVGNLPVHRHSIGHDHAAVSSEGQSQSHSHTVSLSDPGHGHGVTDPGHAHSTTSTGFGVGINRWRPDTNAASGWIYDNPTNAATTGISINGSGTGVSVSSVGNASHDHSHVVNLPAFSGDSGDAGSGTAYFQPFVSVNFIIKHD
jgi:microcystin-dependent protein